MSNHRLSLFLICRLTPITHREGGPTLPPAITPPWLSATYTDTQQPAYASGTDLDLHCLLAICCLISFSPILLGTLVLWFATDIPPSRTRRSSMGLPQADEELEEKLASALNTQNPNSNNGNSSSIATDGTTSMNKLTGTIRQLSLQKQASEVRHSIPVIGLESGLILHIVDGRVATHIVRGDVYRWHSQPYCSNGQPCI